MCVRVQFHNELYLCFNELWTLFYLYLFYYLSFNYIAKLGRIHSSVALLLHQERRKPGLCVEVTLYLMWLAKMSKISEEGSISGSQLKIHFLSVKMWEEVFFENIFHHYRPCFRVCQKEQYRPHLKDSFSFTKRHWQAIYRAKISWNSVDIVHPKLNKWRTLWRRMQIWTRSEWMNASVRLSYHPS